MKRPYVPPKLTKYESVNDLPADLKSQLVDADLSHELMNLVQIIMANCELLDLDPGDDRVARIRDAAFKMQARIKEYKKTA